jgi:hypothetical protein
MAGVTGSAAPTSRRGIVRDGARILAVSFLGWAAGASVVVGLAVGTLDADIGLIVLAATLWAVIPAGILRVLRSRSPGAQPQRQRPRTWAIWFVMAALTGSTIIGIVRPMVESWSTGQIWAAMFLLTPIGIALDSVPRLVRPSGWTSSLAGAPRPIPVTLLSLSLIGFTFAMATANGVVQRGRDETTFVPALPVEALGITVVLSLAAAVAFAVRVPSVSNVAIGLLFAASSFVVQLVWLPVLAGVLVVDRPMLLYAHIGAGIALAIAAAVVQLFRHTGTSTAESALVDWLRAEAILPEAPPAGSEAST